MGSLCPPACPASRIWSVPDQPFQDSSLIQHKALPDNVYDVLLGMLSRGHWEPGAQLSIDKLAQTLGVSQTPVREALVRLEATGLVRREARRGYRVAPPMSVAQMRELVDARIVLETGAIERAMSNADQLLPDLEAAFQAHEEAGQALLGDETPPTPEALGQYFLDDWSFHSAILRHCGNRYIALAVDALGFRVHRMRQAIGTGHSDAPKAIEEHRAILQAVRNGSTEDAVAAMLAHLTHLFDRVGDPSEDVPLS